MKLAFLDIDGVVLIDGHAAPSPDAIAALQHLRDDGWQFVLHSTLRTQPDVMEPIRDTLREHGIVFVGETDHLEASKIDAIYDYVLDAGPCAILIIDDSPLGNVVGFHIRPASNVGLRLVDVVEKVEGK